MNRVDIPDANATVTLLEPLTLLIRQAFEVGTQEAREYFAQREESINPYLFAHLARYRAVCYLRSHAQTLAEFAQDELNNNGIGLVFAGCQLRVWKAQHSRKLGRSRKGCVPGAGHSHTRQLYLSQHIQLPLFSDDDAFAEALRTVDLNLVILWDVDRKHRLSELRLAMPKHATMRETETYWNVVIPNPILSMKVSASAAAAAAAAQDDLFEEIRLPDEGEGDAAAGQGKGND